MAHPGTFSRSPKGPYPTADKDLGLASLTRPPLTRIRLRPRAPAHGPWPFGGVGWVRVTFTSHPQHKYSLAAPPFTLQRIHQQ
ncbi:hypothetical protein BN1723_011149 [Verticillium longisporum]|uniref:Uncharacterized protein n=1 Tax=Verticillium longisporum TaxID=100787 RepID=A0A0G4L4K3_VERLO|nr:hypothetical protein BN1723_011149 [Verticillium longisporum]